MPNRDIETVREDDQWTNVVVGEGPSHFLFETQDEAIAEGRRLAKDAGTDHIVRNEDGTVVERSSYADDVDAAG